MRLDVEAKASEYGQNQGWDTDKRPYYFHLSTILPRDATAEEMEEHYAAQRSKRQSAKAKAKRKMENSTMQPQQQTTSLNGYFDVRDAQVANTKAQMDAIEAALGDGATTTELMKRLPRYSAWRGKKINRDTVRYRLDELVKAHRIDGRLHQTGPRGSWERFFWCI